MITRGALVEPSARQEPAPSSRRRADTCRRLVGAVFLLMSALGAAIAVGFVNLFPPDVAAAMRMEWLLGSAAAFAVGGAAMVRGRGVRGEGPARTDYPAG